jgi:hypothetical protein
VGPERDFLNEVHSLPLQQTLKHLTNAIDDFFSPDPAVNTDKALDYINL